MAGIACARINKSTPCPLNLLRSICSFKCPPPLSVSCIPLCAALRQLSSTQYNELVQTIFAKRTQYNTQQQLTNVRHLVILNVNLKLTDESLSYMIFIIYKIKITEVNFLPKLSNIGFELTK